MTTSTTTNPTTICIVAGEVSGDQLGAGLIARLKQQYPTAKFVGIGGDLMRQQGCETWYDVADLSYFGIVDVVKNLPTILKIIKHTKALVAQHHCDIYIGIDSPDFNLKVAKYCKQELHIPTVQYVSPSVWAWRQGRIKTIKAAVDLVLCLLPFEVEFYQQHQMPARYVGHRLANNLKALVTMDQPDYQAIAAYQLDLAAMAQQTTSALDASASKLPNSNISTTLPQDTTSNSSNSTNNTVVNSTQDSSNNNADQVSDLGPITFTQGLVSQHMAAQVLGIAPSTFNMAVLPGSRKSEIKLILPPFLDGVLLAQQQQTLPQVGLQLLIPVAKTSLMPLLEEIVAQYPTLNIQLIPSQVHQVLQASHVALVASGTATLDTMLCHIPMVIGYKISSLNYMIAKRLVHLPYVALSNIICNAMVSQELLQHELTPAHIAQELQAVLAPARYFGTRNQFMHLHQQLIADSDQLAAQAVSELLTTAQAQE